MVTLCCCCIHAYRLWPKRTVINRSFKAQIKAATLINASSIFLNNYSALIFVGKQVISSKYVKYVFLWIYLSDTGAHLSFPNLLISNSIASWFSQTFKKNILHHLSILMQRMDYQRVFRMWHLTLVDLYEEKSKLHMPGLWLSMVKNLRISRVRALASPLAMKLVVGATWSKTAQTDFCLADSLCT